jgi:hypothetical protein
MLTGCGRESGPELSTQGGEIRKKIEGYSRVDQVFRIVIIAVSEGVTP